MTNYPTPPPQYTTANSVPVYGVEQPGKLLGTQLASWPRRSAATLIDVIVTLWLPHFIPGTAGSVITLFLLVLNSVVMQSRTGQSLGKVLLAVYLIWPVVDPQGANLAAYPSVIRCLLRLPAHLLDTVFFIGFLRPIWNPRRQTFADSICKTVVMVDKFDFVHVPMTSRSLL